MSYRINLQYHALYSTIAIQKDYFDMKNDQQKSLKKGQKKEFDLAKALQQASAKRIISKNTYTFLERALKYGDYIAAQNRKYKTVKASLSIFTKELHLPNGGFLSQIEGIGSKRIIELRKAFPLFPKETSDEYNEFQTDINRVVFSDTPRKSSQEKLQAPDNIPSNDNSTKNTVLFQSKITKKSSEEKEPKIFTLKIELTDDFLEELVRFAIAEGEFGGDVELFLDHLYECIFDKLYEKIDLPDGYYLYTPINVHIKTIGRQKYAIIEYERNNNN